MGEQGCNGAAPPIYIARSPLNLRTAVIAPRRANKGGMTLNLEQTVASWILDINPLGCSEREFRGKPYVDKPCPFEPGKEKGTTAEHAKVQDGRIILHPKSVFPGTPDWDLRFIDNKVPLFDTRDFDTGYEYVGVMVNDGLTAICDARGKDYVLIMTKNHITTAQHINYYFVSVLEQIFTQRELQDPRIKYVVVGSNNPGLPGLLNTPFSFSEDAAALDNLYASLEAMLNGNREAVKAAIENIKGSIARKTGGHYEPKGSLSGASQPHWHGRVISLPLLPGWVQNGYQVTEELSRKMGGRSLYELMFRDEWLIKDEGEFALLADPVPDYGGGLVIIAKNAHNILELNTAQLIEFGEKRKLAQMLVDLKYGGLPSNVYMVQTFGENTEMYPNTRLAVYIAPRTGVKAVLEMATHLDVSTTTPETLANDMRFINQTFLKQ